MDKWNGGLTVSFCITSLQCNTAMAEVKVKLVVNKRYPAGSKHREIYFS